MTMPRSILMLVALLLTAVSLQLAAQPVTDNRIRIGQSGPQTGPLAELNGDYLSGITLYLNAVNAEGGVHGRRVELLTMDDAYDPVLAEQNVKNLIEREQVFALLGVFGTGSNSKTIPLAVQANVPYFAPYTGAVSLREPAHPNVFHLRASYAHEVETIIRHLAQSNVTSIALIHHADPFGEAGLQAAQQALERLNRPPLVAVASVASSGDGMDEAVAKIAEANPAAVIMVSAGKVSSMIIRSLKARDQHPMVFGLSVVSSRELVAELGQTAHGVVLAQVTPSPFRIDHPVVRDYQRMAKSERAEYSYAGLEGFIAAKVFTEALRRAGPELTRSGLLRALEELGGWDVGGLKLNYSRSNHVGLEYVDLSVISHGRFSH